MRSDSKVPFVSSMFGRIARRYDLMNSIMSLGRHQAWRGLAASMAAPKPGLIALDACCGTADFSLALARREARRVVGVDLSRPMLNIGRRKARASPYRDTIVLFLGDALRLPFPSNSFDCATVGFSLRNLDSIPRALEELCRVLKPGGRLANLELTPLAVGWRSGAFLTVYLGWIIATIGGILAQDRSAYQYLPRSLNGFPTAQALSTMMRAAGFRQVSYRKLMMGTVAIHLGEK